MGYSICDKKQLPNKTKNWRILWPKLFLTSPKVVEQPSV